MKKKIDSIISIQVSIRTILGRPRPTEAADACQKDGVTCSASDSTNFVVLYIELESNTILQAVESISSIKDSYTTLVCSH